MVRVIGLYLSDAALFPPPRPPFGYKPERPHQRPRPSLAARLGTLWAAPETAPVMPPLRNYPR
jgi:hypothetical protein